MFTWQKVALQAVAASAGHVDEMVGMALQPTIPAHYSIDGTPQHCIWAILCAHQEHWLLISEHVSFINLLCQNTANVNTYLALTNDENWKEWVKDQILFADN